MWTYTFLPKAFEYHSFTITRPLGMYTLWFTYQSSLTTWLGQTTKNCLYSDMFHLITALPSFYRVGMDRTSGLWGPLICQAAQIVKKEKKIRLRNIFLEWFLTLFWSYQMLHFIYLIIVYNQLYLLSRNIPYQEKLAKYIG